MSGGADKIVFLTDVGTGQPIRKLRGHLSVSGASYSDCVATYNSCTLLVDTLLVCRNFEL